MPFVEIDTLTSLEGPMILLGVLGLLLAGLWLIRSAFKERSRTVARRIDALIAQPGHSGRKPPGPKPRLEGRRIDPQAAGPLTEAEHRQILRTMARWGASETSALVYFKAFRLLLPAALAISTLPLTAGLFARSPALALLVMAVPAAIGWLLPMMIVRRGIKRHSRAVAAGLPDALELLAVCIEAGLSLENGLQRVSGELKRSLPELADELALTWAEINILPNRDQALLNFAERVNVPSVRSVVTTLAQTLRYGTPLARSLRVVAADVRSDQLTAMEEKANRLPALMTIPVMLFIMPTIFLIIGGPAALKLMDIFWGK
jgi:tight adherence protein C